MIVFLYLMSFIVMFPYFELFKNAIKDNELPFGTIMQKHYVFFFMFLPVQFGIAVYLTYFEIKKAKVSKEWGP